MTLDDLIDSLAGGSAWGLGVAAVAGAMLLAGKGARPMAKQTIKGYLVLSERTREFRAEAVEQLEDIYAEVRAELTTEDNDDEAPDLLAADGVSGSPARSDR